MKKVPESMLLSADEKAMKQETLCRLLAYRKAHGLGCYAPLSKASGLATDKLYMMADCTPMPYKYWEALKKGLDKLGA